ncbi:MAG: hypothetical protein J7539_11735 [Niabella sp.]|nr:hypothetical protein [Niabella sp.]
MRTMTLAVLALLLFACHKTAQPVSETCDDTVIISADTFKNATPNAYTISNVTLNQNCLEITVSSSGCDGSSWQLQLVDAAVMPNTPQSARSLKLLLTNKEICAAMVSKKRSFDITQLQVPGTRKIILQLDSWNKPVDYNY